MNSPCGRSCGYATCNTPSGEFADAVIVAVREILNECAECSGGSLNGALTRCSNRHHNLLVQAMLDDGIVL